MKPETKPYNYKNSAERHEVRLFAAACCGDLKNISEAMTENIITRITAHVTLKNSRLTELLQIGEDVQHAITLAIEKLVEIQADINVQIKSDGNE